MILYHTQNRQNEMMIIKGGPIYKLKMVDTDTKREIKLSEHIINHIPDWMIFFFSICEVKETTVRDIYQQTTNLFRTNRTANTVLLKYQKRNGIQYSNWNDYFSTRELHNRSIIHIIKTVIRSYENIIHILSLLKKHSILFVGLNEENIQIHREGDIFFVEIKNSVLMTNDRDMVDDIFSIKYCLEKAIYYPIEYYFLRYMRENHIISPTMETIENVWSIWVNMINESLIGVYFTDVLFQKLKRRYINIFYPLINQKEEKIWASLLFYDWNVYSVNMLYLSMFIREKKIIENHFISCLIEEVLLHFYLYELEEITQRLSELVERYTEAEWKDILNLSRKKKKIKMYIS
jgi:hypothetical protein